MAFKFDVEKFKQAFKPKTSGLDLMHDLVPENLEPFESTGNIESDLEQEVSTLHSELNEQRRKSREHMRVATDTDYSFSVVFLSRAQRDAFLEATGWNHLGAPRFVNGLALAKEMGIEIPEEHYKPSRAKPRKKK